MYNYVLAMALIMDVGVSHNFYKENKNWLVAENIRKISIDWELLDPRESLLLRPEDFENDVHTIQNRYEKFFDVPFVIDAKRFPNREITNEVLAFNREYKKQIEFKIQMSAYQNRERWANTLKETEYLYQVWDKVRDSHCEYYYISVRREALKSLRDMIGEDAYYSGELPPYVPIWRFEKISGD